MCGIAGIVHSNNQPINPELLFRMVSRLRHRGPDGQGFLFSDSTGKSSVIKDPSQYEKNIGFIPSLCLGHSRLSIIDIEGGFQPLSNEDNSVWVTFNGEIYNHFELRNRLLALGHHFKTDHSDTEVIVHAYETWGSKCFSLFRGMFAFCLLDFIKKRLILARDRFGIKPLYYFHNGHCLAFASELSALYSIIDTKPKVDLQAIYDYLLYQYIPAPATIYHKVTKLLPGNYIEIDLKKWISSCQPYYNLLENVVISNKYDEKKVSAELLGILRESVRLRMIADVPVGVFLSGGVDSASVVALMREFAPGMRLRTFSIGFKEKKFNELDGARFIAKRFGTIHEDHVMDMTSFELIPELAKLLDEPLADPSLLPTYLISKMAANHLKVVLSGDGGDEAFAGYIRYYRAMLFHKLIEPIPTKIRKSLFNGLLRFISFGKIGEIAKRVPLTLGEYYALGICHYAPHELFELLKPEMLERLERKEASWLQRLIDESKQSNILLRLQSVDRISYLPGAVLTKVDRASMACSLEVRSPFLDHQLHEMTTQLPTQAMIMGRIQKYILKRAMSEHLPKQFLQRPKRGFGLPLDMWFRTDKGLAIIKETLNNASKLSNWMDMKKVVNLVERHRLGQINGGFKIWSLLILEHWLRGNAT